MAEKIKLSDKEVEYEKLEKDDILKWCKENNQLEWLLAKANEKVTINVYEKSKTTTYTTKAGKTITRKVADKSKIIGKNEEAKISFIEIRYAFCKEFFPDSLPEKKAKEKTLLDMIKEELNITD